jgi:hypothetical protein
LAAKRRKDAQGRQVSDWSVEQKPPQKETSKQNGTVDNIFLNRLGRVFKIE